MAASQAEELRQSASAGHVDKVHELCKAGAKIDPDLEGRTALHLASANGHLATVKALINAGAKVNARDAAGYSPLHQAATEGHEEVVVLLLKNGCHVDTQDELHGNTALHEAAWKGYSRTVEALCKHKANVYIKNNGGFTPLHLTCQNGHNQSCRMLLLSACKPDVRNSYGDTPLHTAARYGHAGVLRILISAFCSASETNKNGDTALHISAAMGRRKLTKILIEAGCDQKLKNNQSETARDIAERKSFNEVVGILDNPPLTLIPVLDNEKNPTKPFKNSSKKREKESGTSQESASKDKKDKSKKSKKKQSVHFSTDGLKKKGNVSPYGCHMYPNLEFFPSIKMKSLPPEPLKKGEQYYADLAGNIKKGPRGLGYMCYCAPFFERVDKKLDTNKQELLKHIDAKNEDLKAKITHLEQRTHDQLFSLNQRMKENLAFERTECSERMDRCLLRERSELQSQQENSIQNLRSEMKSYMNSNHRHFNGFDLGTYDKPWRCRMQDSFPISRSKSADLLSESDSHQWNTGITSNTIKVNDRPLSNYNGGFFGDLGQRLPGQQKSAGARPKHVHNISPKMSRWKAKCYGNSVYSRDSRSEGDLTSCHTEIIDQYSGSQNDHNHKFSGKNINPINASGVSNANNLPSQPENAHRPIRAYQTAQTSSSGALWNLNRSAIDRPLKITPQQPKPDDNYRFSTACHQNNNNQTEFSRSQQNKPLLIGEQKTPSTKLTTNSRTNQEGIEINAVAVNRPYRSAVLQHVANNDAKRENGTPSISVEPDGSSFV